ncbi:MAG: YfhO family protein [Caldilineaceae bacterium]
MRAVALTQMLPALLLLLFVLLLYYPLLFTNRVLASGDILHYFYPYRDYAASAFREGKIPLWNPYIFLGAPFLANPQTAVLYPLHWPLSWLPVTKQIYWSAALHTWILGLGGYHLMRRWRLSLLAGLTTAVVLAGSGFYGGLLGHINQMNAAAWLPWGIVVIEGVQGAGGRVQGAGSKNPLMTRNLQLATCILPLAFMALLVALMLLAGHTQTAYINLFGIGVWALLRSFVLATNGDEVQSRWRFPVRSFWIGVNPQPLVIFLLGCLLSAGLVAAQLLPTLELNGLGLRSGGLSYGEASSFSLKPLQLFWTLLPSYGLVDLGVVFGSLGYSEYVAYVGIIALLLAIWMFRSWIVTGGYKLQNLKAEQGFGLLFAGLGFFLALGRWNPFYYLLFKLIPGFDLFRAPARWMMLYTLGMAVLAGVGIANYELRIADLAMPIAVRQRWKNHLATLSPSHVRPAVGIILSSCLLLLLALDLLLASRSLPYAQTTAPQAVYDLRTAPAFLLTDPARQQGNPAASGRFLSMSTITFDPGDMGDYRRILSDTGQLDERGFSQLVIAQKSQEILAPNLPLLWRVAAVDGFDGGVLPLKRYNEFLTTLIPADQLVPDGRLREQIKVMPATRLLNLLNAQYIITDKVRDLWFEGVYYDRQIGARLQDDQVADIAVEQHFEATHLDLIAFVEEPNALSADKNMSVATVQVIGDRGKQDFTLLAGGQAGAQLADGTLDSALAQSSGAIVALRDVEGNKQEYRVRLILDKPTSLQQIRIAHSSAAPVVVIQAATLYDARTAMFQPLLPSDRGHFRLVHSGDVKIYENLDHLLRAYLVHQVESAQSGEEAVAKLQAADFDPAQRAIVTGLPAFQAQPDRQESVEMISYKAERVEVRTQSASQSLLVLDDAYYPGWKATVDGVESTIYPVNHLFRGVALQAGAHNVVFEFAPRSWQRGVQISLVSCLLWSVLVLIGFAAGRR